MKNNEYSLNERLLKVVMEQLKLPLLHIARRAELGADIEDTYISDIADIALKTIDSFLLSLSEANQATFALEPVSMASVLNSTANNLNGVAKVYNCQVEIDLPTKALPIMADRARLESAFTMLGYAFIEAQHAQNKFGRVLLSAYKSVQGTTAGIFCSNIDLSNNILIRSLDRTGQARQTLPQFSQSAGAGVYIADSLLSTISTKLRVARHQNLQGLVATLIPSQQLQLVEA